MIKIYPVGGYLVSTTLKETNKSLIKQSSDVREIAVVLMWLLSVLRAGEAVVAVKIWLINQTGAWLLRLLLALAFVLLSLVLLLGGIDHRDDVGLLVHLD